MILPLLLMTSEPAAVGVARLNNVSLLRLLLMIPRNLLLLFWCETWCSAGVVLNASCVSFGGRGGGILAVIFQNGLGESK